MIILGWRESILNGVSAEHVITLIGGSNLLLGIAITALIGGALLLIESGRQAARWD